jgi:alkaline phosphatase D
MTDDAGRPIPDHDANGYPRTGRDRALRLLRQARALVLSGDQHLATLVRHGLDTFTDGVVQFTGPAGGTDTHRWFEPANPLPHAGAAPHTGDFVDAFGNKVRVLAVANAKISRREYGKLRKASGHAFADRRLKSEGYGLVRVDRKAREFVLECWPWDADPAAPGARQFEGWPYRLPFDQVAGG